MKRRTFLTATAGSLVALIGAGAGLWTQMPVIPKRPDPDLNSAMGWITHNKGQFTLTLPRVEMGQNIATALKQIACTELNVDWNRVFVRLHDTSIARVKSTVGSESVMHFAEPLAQACAALRDALEEGHTTGRVKVVNRPVKELRALRPGGLIGTNPELVQGHEIVTGHPLYAADIRRPGMLYGRVLRAQASVELKSFPKRWNIQAAQSVPGFVAIVEECGPPVGKAQGLGIVASRPGALEAITEALQVEWDVENSSHLAKISDTIDIDKRLNKGHLPNIVLDGTPEDGSWDVDLRIDFPPAAHRPIEPRAAIAEWHNNKLTVWAGSQDSFFVRDVLTNLFGLSSDAVRVQSCRIGGAFGGKTLCTAEIEAAILASSVNAPVKVQRTHAQEFSSGFHRPPSSHRIRARLDNGRITDWDHTKIGSHILFTPAGLSSWMQMGTDILVGDPGVARGMDAPYVLGRARATYDLARLPVHSGPWRGLGAGPNGLAIESAIDEAAIAANADPLAFRLSIIKDPRLAAVLNQVGEIALWGNNPSAPEAKRAGRGIACGIYKKSSYAAVVCDVIVATDGEVKIAGLWCVHDCGLVINPGQVRAQCEGNLVWSIGMVLSDDLPLEGPNTIAESFLDAPMPRITEIPPIIVELIHSDNAPTGAGETAIVAGPAAIANAIRAATGRRIKQFPVNPEELAI